MYDSGDTHIYASGMTGIQDFGRALSIFVENLGKVPAYIEGYQSSHGRVNINVPRKIECVTRYLRGNRDSHDVSRHSPDSS